MTNKRPVAALSVLTMLLTSCGQKAEFSGESPRRAREINTPGSPPPCERTAVKPVDVLFLIDNSGSMAETDPALDRIAVVEDTLATIQDTSLAAQTNFAWQAVTFTPEQRGRSQTRELTNWEVLNGDTSKRLANLRRDLGQAKGDTPYANAIRASSQSFSERNQDKARFALMITDGEPTDRDPRRVEEEAKALREALGINVLTVFITGDATRIERASSHHDTMADYQRYHERNGGEGSWPIGFENDFEGYMQHLLKLGEAISSQYVEVADGAELRRYVAEEVVEKQMLACD